MTGFQVGASELSLRQSKKETARGFSPAPRVTLRRIVKTCLDRFAGGRGRFFLRERAVAGVLVGGLVDLDGTFEVGAVFDHDARRGEVAVDRAVFLDFDTILRAKIAFHRSVDDDFTGDDIGGDLGGRADGELPRSEAPPAE